MDRSAFLHALPFLRESVSSAWPPQSNSQVLLKDHVVSMEPISVDTNESIGPAFFGKSHSDENSFDPSICSLEAAIVETTPASPAVSSSASTTLSISPRTPTTTTIKQERMNLYFRIDKQGVFQVDCSRLKRITVIPGVEKKTDGQTTGKFLPPCLLFYFDSTCFRVFSMSACSGDANHDLLQTAFSKLKAVPTGDQAISFAEMCSSELTTPTGSSAPSSLEPGQREPLLGTDEENTPGSSKCSVELDAVSRRIKRRHISLQNSWKGLQSLQTVLEMPKLHHAITNSSSLADTFGPLLTATAQDLVDSSQEGGATIQQHCLVEMDQYQAHLDNILSSAFPSKKRRGMSATPQTQNFAAENLQDLMEHAQGVLEKQKRAVETRHRLSLLP